MQDRKQLIDSKENNNLFSCCECEIEHFFHKYRRVSLIKKSYELFFLFFTTVADSEGSRYFSEEANGPFRSNTWGLQQPLGMFNVCQAMLFRNPVVCAAKRRVE